MSDTPQKGSTLPPRNRNSQSESIESFIDKAPLQTNADQQTNPSESESDKKPWRKGINLSEGELMLLTHKTTNNMPMELELRLQYLMTVKQPKGFGRKINRNTLIVEAVDAYTKAELKKLGLDVNK